MKTKEEISLLIKDMAAELNIVRAGALAKIRILDASIAILKEYPGYFEGHQTVLNLQLEFRYDLQKTVDVVSKKIEQLKSEIHTGSLTEKSAITKIFEIINSN